MTDPIPSRSPWEQVEEELQCGRNKWGHYCPNCDRSLSSIKKTIDAARAADQAEIQRLRDELAQARQWQNQNAMAAITRDEELRQALASLSQITQERDALLFRERDLCNSITRLEFERDEARAALARLSPSTPSPDR